MLPHIDMGGYKGKVRKISGKVHFFLDVSFEMPFEVCRIYGFVGLLAHPSSFLVIVLICPCFSFLARPYITGQQFSFYAPRMGRYFLRCSR